MSKIHTTLTVDPERLQRVKQLNLNISGLFNEFLQGVIDSNNENLEGIDIKLERINLEKYLKKLNYYQNSVKTCQKKIETYEKLQKDKEISRLKQEKKELENAKRCIECGNIQGEDVRMHKFTKGMVCNGCYMAGGSEKVKEWLKK